MRAGSKFSSACARAVRPSARRRSGSRQELLDGVCDRLDAVVGDEQPGLVRDDDAAAGARAGRDDGDTARSRLDHRPAELRSLRRRDDDVGRLVEAGCVLREWDEADDLVEPQVVHELLRLRLVVARQVGELCAPADDGSEELLAANCASDDEVARFDSAVAQPRSDLDELAEPLRRVDESEERDDRQICREAESLTCGVALARMEAAQVDGVRDDRRADPEHVRDVVVDRDRRRREAADRASDHSGAAVAAFARQRRAEVPDDGQPFASREPRRGDERRVVEVHELEPPLVQRAPELVRMARQPGQLAREQQPAAAPIRRRPDVGEAGDGARVYDRAGLAEEVGRRARRAVDVRLELVPVELADQVREGLRCAAELAAVVDEEDRQGARPGTDLC